MQPTLILAHGSGQPSNSPWMTQLTQRLQVLGVKTILFNFEYMNLAMKAGKPRPPSRLNTLIDEYRAVLDDEKAQHVFIGGKSLGGRVASHLATEVPVAGLIAFGYPFHPPGKPDKLRTGHLGLLKCPTLICQGERDPFGRRHEVESYDLPDSLQLCWLKDGDHQFKPLKRSSASHGNNLDLAAQAAVKFMESTHDTVVSLTQA
jgi:uncharacterized protein